MPLGFMLAAMFSGLTMAFVWLVLGGTALGAFIAYVLSGHLAIAAMMAHAAFREFR
ncbi:MAG: hypothetical protein AB8B60_01435 [Sulfitobacter sp.]